MPTYYAHISDETINLEAQPFAKGGEGNLYHIQGGQDYKGCIAKIYHTNKRTARRESKLQYLIRRPPNVSNADEHVTVVWPKDLLYDEDGRFVGFIMPYVRGEKLEVLCTTKLPRGLGDEWQRFKFSKKEALKLRLKLCFNIGAAVNALHETGRYVIVDLKPDNILVQSNGLISLVDIDSIAVVRTGTVLFDAPVATPDFTPPEAYESHYNKQLTQQETWDRFCLAIIFYKLLFGIHPYAASATVAPYDGANTLSQKIKFGLFVHTETERSKAFDIIPQPHRHFNRIHKLLRDLFLRCFDAGHTHPNRRPRAEEWGYAILTSQEALETYTLPSEQFDIPTLVYSSQDFDVILEQWKTPDWQEPRLKARTLTPQEYIAFKPYGVGLEIRFANIVLFGMGVIAVVMNPFHPMAILWVVLLLLASNDLYSYYFRPERRAKLKAERDCIDAKQKYERKHQDTRLFFQKVVKKIEPITKLYEKIPLDRVHRWLKDKKSVVQAINRFQLFLEQADMDTQKIIEAADNALKQWNGEQKDLFENNAAIAKYEGKTANEKLRSLLAIENQQLGEVEERFMKQKAAFERNLEKHRKIIELNEQESQLLQILERLRNEAGPKIEQELAKQQQKELEDKRAQYLTAQNKIAENQETIFSAFATNPLMIHDLVDNLLKKEGITEVNQVRNLITKYPAKEYYWEDKTHVIYLKNTEKVRIYENYDRDDIQNALQELLEASKKIDETYYAIALSEEENQQLIDSHEQRMSQHRKKVAEKESQLREVQTEKQTIHKSLANEAFVSLDQFEKEYNEATQKVKDYYANAKQFLKDYVANQSSDRKTITQKYIEEYDKLIKRCQHQFKMTSEAVDSYKELLTAEDYEKIQAFLDAKDAAEKEINTLRQDFQTQQYELEDIALTYSNAQTEVNKYQNITFKSHLQQLFIPEK